MVYFMKVQKIILTSILLLLIILPLSSAEMWKFIPTEEFGGFVNKAVNYNQDIILKIYSGNDQFLVSFDGTNIQKFGTDYINQNLNPSNGQLITFDDCILIPNGDNKVFKYNANKEWSTIQFEDKYNSQDNKFGRSILRVSSSSTRAYFLSQAIDIKSKDTLQSGAIQIIGDAGYNEILSYDGLNLNKDYFIDTEVLGRFYDIAADEDGLWVVGQNNLYFMKDNELVDTVDISNKLGFDEHSIYSNISVTEDYVYLLKQRTGSGATVPSPYFISYNKKTEVLEKIKFPLDPLRRNPNSFSEMVSYNKNHLFIASSGGVFEYYDNKLSYVDIFSQFLSEIPEVFQNYLTSSDITISGDKFYVSTSVGLIYTDVFTDVEEFDKQNTSIKVYPNVLNEFSKILTLESNLDMTVNSIEIYNMSGEVVSQITDMSQIKKGNNSLKLNYLSSGKYFLTIKTMKENFIVPLIINK